MTKRRWVRIDCDYYLDEDEIFPEEPFTQREAYQWLIMNAAWKDTTHTIGNKEYPVLRGSQYRTIRKLCKEWQWGNTKVRNFLEKLERKHKIVTESNTGKTLITLCNYSKFQDRNPESNTETTHPQDKNNTETTQEQHTKGTNNTNNTISSSLHSEDITAIQKPDNQKLEISQAFEAYNLAAQKNGWAVSQLTSKTRISHMKGRLKECGGLEGWMIALEKCEASDFLSGRKSGSRGPFKLTIDFLLSQGKFAKVMEGNYDNPKPANGTSEINPEDMSIAAMFGKMAKEGDEQERSVN